MEEKRKNPRIDKALIVQFALDTPESLQWDSTAIKNISVEGLSFDANQIFTNNLRLQLRFVMPNDPFNRLELVGQVVGSSVRNTRIKFVNLTESQKKVIGDYTDGLSKKSSNITLKEN